MTKKFNYRGPCNPQKHYMVDTSQKIEDIIKLIEKEEYITINRPRQFGKSTTLSILAKKLRQRGYIVIKTSFEGRGSVSFDDESKFVRSFLKSIKKQFTLHNIDKGLSLIDQSSPVSDMEELDDLITGLITELKKDIVLFIDEVDRSSNNDLFIDFLGMLRNKYIGRNDGEDFTFKSVILAGVHDVKSLKLKIAPGSERKYNSPWNIAMDLPVDLSFTSVEIVTMLSSYSEDKKIKMDIPAISERLYYYTSGYPFLVSRLCYLIDDTIMKESCWQTCDVDTAFKAILKEDNTNFENVIKNLENKPDLYNLVFDLIIEGYEKFFNHHNPVIKQGIIHGILKNQEGPLEIQNKIYREIIYNYMSSKIETSMNMGGFNAGSGFVTPEGALNLEKVLIKFQAFMKEQYSEKDDDFLERNGRLIFLAFIKPIVNGKGFDFKEVQVSEEKRLDVVITYGPYKYIVELKIWKGAAAHEEGILQLTDYLERQDCDKGYLLIFNFNQNKEWKTDRISEAGKDIFAVWV